MDGAPGVRSARYAGENATDEENLPSCCDEVSAEGDTPRGVRVRDRVRRPDGEEHVFEGRCEGTLAHEPRGSGGFGYDPAFVPADRHDGRTMAELSRRRRTPSAIAAAQLARSSTG